MMGRYRAIIFDLFGTLIDEWDSRLEGMRQEMARVLGIEPGEFDRAWTETSPARGTGGFETIEANLWHISKQLMVPIESSQVAAATAVRMALTRQTLTPRPDAVATLKQLKAMGFKIGLLSNCTPEVPILWSETECAPLVDAPVFSSVAGYVKPDARIYQVVLQQLAVKPSECLCVGDGDGNELQAAQALGMTPVLVRMRYGDNTEAGFRLTTNQWPGSRISSLQDLLGQVD